MASWSSSVCRLQPSLVRCSPVWHQRTFWPAANSNGATVRCSATEAGRLPPPDVRKLAQLAQIAVTDEEVRESSQFYTIPHSPLPVEAEHRRTLSLLAEAVLLTAAAALLSCLFLYCAISSDKYFAGLSTRCMSWQFRLFCQRVDV